MRTRTFLSMLAGAGAFFGTALGAGAAAPPSGAAASAAAAAAAQGGGGGEQSYEKFTKGAESQTGLFTLYRKEGKVYLELQPAQFDHEYLEHGATINGLGGFGVLSGDDFQQEARIVKFERVDEKHVALVWPQILFQAQPNTPLAQAIAGSTADSVQGVAAVAAEDDKTKNVVVDMSLLLGDNLNLGENLSEVVKNPENPAGGYHLDPSRTYFGPDKAFPKNVVIEADQTFASAKPDVINTVVDARYVRMRVKYNFAEIPASPDYMPRLTDDRVGFWDDPHIAFDRDDNFDDLVHYVMRWDLKASDPSKPLSPAVKPIVYTLSNTIPMQYRQPIRDAVLEWNKAFEKIGISGAVQVQDQPADPAFDPDDIRYNVIRWLTEANNGGFAEAQIEWDPRTGEIFRGGVLIDADIMRFGKFIIDDVVTPTNPTGDPGAPLSLHELGARNDLWDAASIDPAAYGAAPVRRSHAHLHRDTGMHENLELAAIALSGNGRSVSPVIANEYLKAIVLHEVGHDFGLAHNFIGHDAFTADQLRSKQFTAHNGVASSVMEYAPLNLWPQGQSRGDLVQLTLGPYDYHVIHWGYAAIPTAKTPQDEASTLDRWAQASADRHFAFASDEDVQYDGHAVDPRIAQYMLTDHPIQWCETQLSIYDNLMKTIDSRYPRAQEPWDQERFAVAIIANEYNRCANSMTHYIAGEYLSRARRGDPRSGAPLTAVPRDVEVHAYRDLDKYLFSDDAWRMVSPGTLSRLVYTEYENFGNFGYDPTPRHDISLAGLAARFQSRSLAYMFSPLVLQRLADLPSKYRPVSTMSLGDLFAWTQTSIVGDLSNGRLPQTPIRRNLQRGYVRLLARLAVAPYPGTPYDAQALARHELTTVRSDTKRLLGRRDLDLQTRAHLEAIVADIDRAFDTRSMSPSG